MSNAATVQDVVTRRGADPAVRSGVQLGRSKTILSGRRLTWAALLVAGAAAIVPMVRLVVVNLETWTLLQADNASVRSQLVNVARVSASPDYLEALAELGVQPTTQNLEAARAAAQAAVQADPTRAHAWALLAYLGARKDGKVTPAALDALTHSMDACPLCDQDLIRWRFNFVLANWNAVPDELRRRAFDQADVLRWSGQNSEFLAEMRMKALGAGVPFDEYRLAVSTPVRVWDVGPASGAAATGLLRPKT